MSEESKNPAVSRRTFVKAASALGVSLGAAVPGLAREPEPPASAPHPIAAVPAQNRQDSTAPQPFTFPRRFTGNNLNRISFPLGGIGTGSIGLGGRGNLQDWEIFNHPDTGRTPGFCFPAIWVKTGAAKPVARVLERKIFPPFDTTPEMVREVSLPGLPRLDEAVFHGNFPVAKVDFQDSGLPVQVGLEAYSSMRPVNHDECSIPAAILEYTVTNPGSQPAEVVIAWSAMNSTGGGDKRTNEIRKQSGLLGLGWFPPADLPKTDPMYGTFILGALADDSMTAVQPRWYSDNWRTGATRFWHHYFTPTGDLGDYDPRSGISFAGSISIRQTIPAGEKRTFRFVMAWHFPNRTALGMGWPGPKGKDKFLGNFYNNHFQDAWEVATHVQAHLSAIATGTRAFADALATSTLPAAVLDAATANLSTMSSETIFRIADGSMHAFEGCGDHRGMGQGSCTHVWNYEATTPFVYPAIARSMRETSFTIAMQPDGAQDFRHGWPDYPTTERVSAVDGTCGQIVKLYQDFRIAGDLPWLQKLWPECRKAMSFAWIPGGWDPGARGILDGKAHNTYDIDFYGPNPLSQTYYLAALRASAEMATAVGDKEFASKCAALASKASAWMDANLFNGEFYIQKMDTSSPKEHPFQLGSGCLIDQLMGVYLAELAGIDDLIEEKNIRSALAAVQRYNSRASMHDEPSTLRTYAYEDQKAIVMCDYSHGGRPTDPFPYYSENWTGCEYAFAALMMRYGMIREAVTAYENVRARYDGEHSNPWGEAEYGRHYARPMSAWSGLVMLSGFRYDGLTQHLRFAPLLPQANFRTIWTASSGWGIATQTGTRTAFEVKEGKLQIAHLRLATANASTRVQLAGQSIAAKPATEGSFTTLTFSEPVTIPAGSQLTIG